MVSDALHRLDEGGHLPVLILVVMEYGLGPIAFGGHKAFYRRLNPCCNGIWSQTAAQFFFLVQLFACLNPCCNGIWSQTNGEVVLYHAVLLVLILVVMEYGLRHNN